MEASLGVRAAQLRDAWVHAVQELHDQAQRVQAGDSDPAQVVGLLHVLDERAREAFARYRQLLLQGPDTGSD